MPSRLALPVPSRVALAPSLFLLTACAQGTLGLSPSQMMTAAVMIGEAVDAAGRTSRTSGPSGGSSGSSGSSSGVRIPRSPAPTASAARVLQTADRYVGVPYVWGGNTPDGFDCSGFTKYVFARQGVSLPRTSREQSRVGQSVDLDFAGFQPGDLLFFAEPGEAVSHVAIYVGNGEIIHASSAMGQVGYLDLNGNRSAWYIQNMVAVRRMR